MSTQEQGPTVEADRFTALPDEETLAATVSSLERNGFGVEVVDDSDAARAAVLDRIPEGATVMTNPSVTLEETGIAAAVDADGPYESVRAKGAGLDRETQMREIKEAMILPDFALGSVHAITRDGTLVIASALGSQLASYTWGAGKVIFIAGAQKLVPHLRAAHERISQHCLELESGRTMQAYGQGSRIGKILEIHQEEAGRIHVVIIRAAIGF